jgi:hypothetical protein
MKKTIAIIHYNTPELTEAAILSVRKHCREDYAIVVFDNSDSRPFTKRMKGVKVVDNTKGKVVDFDAELAKFPNKCWEMAHKSNYGSAKHMMSVQKLWELIPDGFILMESDVLIAQSFDFLWDEQYAACGKVQWFRGRRDEKDRLLPWLCYMNVPLLVKNGAKYYDPERCWALQPGGKENPNNWYDTGASLLEDIINTKPQLTARLYPRLDQYYVHYFGGSWRQKDIANQKAWLERYRDLWEPIDNSDAKIFICSHTDFEPVVKNEVYEIIDSRKLPKPDVPDLYYSELWQMKKVSERKKLPKYIGFCHYRRYFGFMDAVPNIGKLVEKYGAIVTKPFGLGLTMREQYATCGNPEDLDICTKIINEKYPDFAPAWNRSLESRKMRLGTLSIMRTDDWMEMLEVMWDVAQEYLERIGGDIEKRVTDNQKAYHIGEHPFTTFTHELRVGGQFAERINSAWVDWKFPRAYEVPLKITREKIEIPYEKPKKTGKPKATKRTNKKGKKI